MRSLFFVLVAIAWACDASKPDAASHPESAPPSSVTGTPRDTVPAGVSEKSASELDEWISRLAKGVDTNITLGAWLAGHPGDSVSRTVPAGMDDEPFCRSAIALITAGTRVWRRSAVFVIPPPPAGESLPDTAAVAKRLCRLRALWLESSDQDSLEAERVAQALQAPLSRALGEGRPGVLVTGPGTAAWRGGRSWTNGLRVVVLGTAPAGRYREETDTALVFRPATAAALSYVIGNGFDTSVFSVVRGMEYPKVEPEALVAMARADSALGWSGMSGLAPLRRVFAYHQDSAHFKQHYSRPPPDPSVDSALVRALAALRDSSRLLPRQQSAAFLAADIAVHVHARELDNRGPGPVVRSWLRAELERLGAPYEYDQLGAAYFYLRPWLWRAYQLDSLGPAGKSASAELLREGWSTALACGDGSDLTGKVIGRGERALDAGLADPMVHMYVAQAYADVFSLSQSLQGASESASDSARTLAAKAETGRRRAIEHYREALVGVRDPGLRRRIWIRSVRLMLRRPVETRYFCEYD